MLLNRFFRFLNSLRLGSFILQFVLRLQYVHCSKEFVCKSLNSQLLHKTFKCVLMPSVVSDLALKKIIKRRSRLTYNASSLSISSTSTLTMEVIRSSETLATIYPNAVTSQNTICDSFTTATASNLKKELLCS
jgi:hypothetical protein